jgi:hypothetical protein
MLKKIFKNQWFIIPFDAITMLLAIIIDRYTYGSSCGPSPKDLVAIGTFFCGIALFFYLIFSILRGYKYSSTILILHLLLWALFFKYSGISF